MELNSSILVLIMQLFIGLDLLVLAVLLLSKRFYRRSYKKKRELSRIVNEHVLSTGDAREIQSLLRRNSKMLFQILRELGDAVHLPQEVKDRWDDLLSREGYVAKLCRRLEGSGTLKRVEAITGLGAIGGEKADKALLERFLNERRWFIRLMIIHVLARHGYSPAVAEIFRVLKGAPKWIRQKSFAVLPLFGEELEKHIAETAKKPGERDRDLLFELGERYSCEGLNDFLIDALEGSHGTLMRRAAEALEKGNPRELQKARYYTHGDPEVRAAACRSLRWRPEEETVSILLQTLKDPEREVRRAVVLSLQEIIAVRPQHLETVVERFHGVTTTVERLNLARVLESRLEYFLYRINSEKYPTVKELIETLAEMGRLSVLFGFLERNHVKEIEETILDILKPIADKDRKVAETCSRYLPVSLLEKLSLERIETRSTKQSVPLKKGDRRILITLLAAILLSGPAIYLFRFWGDFGMVGGIGEVAVHLPRYSQIYNYLFAFYSISINSIYLLLLIFAMLHLVRQHRYWRVSSFQLLFARDLLPSISVLAPAYNEELSIVDNVKSLVNLHYPDTEIIIINDGSKDGTMDRLLENFELHRVDREGRESIETEPVRGIYISRKFPNLTVVDKVNGGKADSLNAGINLASKDYICTIDSDSLLEQDALLKTSFHTVLCDREPVAVGGNIIPANGCTVRNGRLVRIALAKDHLSRFQTIEYMRAFLAGRLGWSFINSMVIISGAFGLFLRKRVVEVGGYLTPKSRYHASTVGEDMELVVRLHEHLRRKKIPYKVYDAFNANCWTEVPDSFKILHRQRDRWHRGLIESILLHKKMLFNPRYGPIGTVAFPYFVIFELVGPFFELFGYVNLFISLIFGLLSPSMALLLFIAVILYGILISLGSLLISENEVLYFNVPETFKIILYAFVENFGFRQVMSAIRVTSYVSFLFKEKSWGEMERKGFASGGKK